MPSEIVIIGAGNIGYTIARTLSKKHSIMLIEGDEDKFGYILDYLDVAAMNANGASPKVLREIIDEQTKLVIAVTERDEVNMFACAVAKQVKADIITVARVRNPEYEGNTAVSKMMNVDFIISPERIVAEKMIKLAEMENLVDWEELPGIDVSMGKFQISGLFSHVFCSCAMQLPIPEGCKILAIHRERTSIIPDENYRLVAGDEVTVIGRSDCLSSFDQYLGRKMRMNDFVIVGGGILGEHLVNMLETKGSSIKVIEEDEKRCNFLSKRSKRTVVVIGNGSDPSILKAENVGMADVLFAVTENEDKNLITSLIAKQLGIPKVIASYSKRDYEDAFSMSEIDADIGYYHVVANEIIRIIYPGFKALLFLETFSEMLFSLDVDEGSGFKGLTIEQIELPDRTTIAMILRNGRAQVPYLGVVLEKGDTVLFYTVRADIPALERILNIQIPVNP